MNANQIINMVIRQVMRIAINKGVNMGIKGATGVAQKVRKAQKRPQDDIYTDDPSNR